MSSFAIVWFFFWGIAWLTLSNRVWRIIFHYRSASALILAHGHKDGDALLTLEILDGPFKGKTSSLALPSTSTAGYPINGTLLVAHHPKDVQLLELPVTIKDAALLQAIFLMPCIIYYIVLQYAD